MTIFGDGFQDAEPCLVLEGSRHRDGYVWRWDSERKKDVLAHRFAWEQEHGSIPKGMYVCHHCDNPPCSEITHLFLGTQYDNMRDCWAKGRGGGSPIQKRAQTHCTHGHEFTPENTVVRPNGTRNCRTCKNERRRVS
jgi:hypothetical protein